MTNVASGMLAQEANRKDTRIRDAIHMWRKNKSTGQRTGLLVAEDWHWEWDVFTKRLEGSFRAKGNVLSGVW